MKYISTRGEVAPVAFQDAVLMGLADDGGLVIPESIPNVTDRLDDWRELSYADLAFEILRRFTTDIPENDLRALIDKTYGPSYFVNDTTPQADRQVAPVVCVGDLYILELWHGPTLAFKDVALQLLGNLFEYILARRGGRLSILGATSGDTGSAAIHGCRGRAGLDIFVMHPNGRVSPIQEHQMTSVLDDNVHNLAIEGSFDDCQNIMKTLAADLDFKRQYFLGAVNSVNWARVLAQIVYYFHGAFRTQELAHAQRPSTAPCDAEEKRPSTASMGFSPVRVSVPTGNFGDVLAGWYAMKMGAPIAQLILATNENDILTRFYNTGDYSLGQEVKKTLSPSMDIQVASNFERYLYYRIGGDAARLRDLMNQFGRTGSLRVAPGPSGAIDVDFIAARADTPQVLQIIGAYHEKYGYVLDPHTACGVCAAEGFLKGNVKSELPILCLATAHPAKFPAAIAQATGRDDLARHPAIDAMMHKPTRCQTLPNDKEAVRKFMIDTLG